MSRRSSNRRGKSGSRRPRTQIQDAPDVIQRQRGRLKKKGPDVPRIPADSIQPGRLDRDAKRVVKRLQQHGHEAYFVGGCVRDLLLGQRPKDFDVATSARPSEVRRIFRNCRIIGRRFKLAHVFYHENIIETATFRAAPQDEDQGGDDLLIVDDNEYGTAESDARRRDFTVNALFLDPTTHEILDHVGGLKDLEARTLKTIGDPEVRLAEDPVRILRAIKFATRLDLEINDPTWEAMCDLSADLEKAAPPRVLEEIMRLTRSGTATSAFQMLRDCGALAVLIPQLEEFLGPEDDIPERAEPFWDLLAALDARVRARPEDPPSSGLLIATLFLLPFQLALDNESEASESDEPLDARTRSNTAWDVLEPMSAAARLSRKDFSSARRILVAHQNFTHQPERFSEVLFARSEEFPESYELFAMTSQAQGEGQDLVEAWRERWLRAKSANAEELEDERRKTGTRKRRRKRRRRGKSNR